MRVVIAPDSFGGTLSASEAAAAIRAGWLRVRPADEVVTVPLADGGEGTLDVVATADDGWRRIEVADPRGRPRHARWLLRPDGTAIVESAEACGLALLAPGERDPLGTTTYGVGQLLEDARRAGADRVVVGLGGSATVDGGAGALAALGVRVLRADGQGVKIGGGELAAVNRVEAGWLDPAWGALDVVLWSDVRTPLTAAAEVFGPQKGAAPEAVERLRVALDRWADVVERDLGRVRRDEAGTGAAGGLGFGLAAALGARIVPGAEAVARLRGLGEAVRAADLVVTGEGRLDASSSAGKVVDAVVGVARAAGVDVVAVAGGIDEPVDGLVDAEAAAPDGPGGDPAGEVVAAAAALAGRAAG